MVFLFETLHEFFHKPKSASVGEKGMNYISRSLYPLGRLTDPLVDGVEGGDGGEGVEGVDL